ncbi:MAG TPA: hypothetical protein VIK89_13105 [Cytophagaceae bacterium]
MKLNERIVQGKTIEIKDYVFLVKTNVSTDTIYKVDYEKYSEEIECNKCFLRNDSETAIMYRDLSFHNNGIKYYQNDTLKIFK